MGRTADDDVTRPDGRDSGARIHEDVALQRLRSRLTGRHRAVAVGRYRIIDEVGRGGMGVVYEARDPELDRRVALKTLLSTASSSDEARARMLREAQAMARLSHLNVAQVFDVGLHDGCVFLAMQFVEGPTLRQWLEQEPRSIAAIVDVFTQAGRGLAAAHSAGFLHRDFKPSNVMIDGRGRALVMDFGLARSVTTLDSAPTPVASGSSGAASASATHPTLSRGDLSRTLTRDGIAMGTPSYMAPEQHRGHAEERSDQYSFCIALYEALVGHRPHEADSLEELIAAKMATPKRHRRRIPKTLWSIIVRGLEHEPRRRHRSMNEVVDTLQAVRTERRTWPVMVSVGAVASVIAIPSLVDRPSGVSQRCEAASTAIADVWNNKRIARIRWAFQEVSRGYATDAVGRVSDRIDGYVATWHDVHATACTEGAPQTHTDAEIEATVACLEQTTEALRAAVELFEAADEATVIGAVQQASRLPRVQGCRDTGIDPKPRFVPADPEMAAAVADIRARAAHGRALGQAGRYAEAVAVAETLVEEARELGYGPLTAEVVADLGIGQLFAYPQAAGPTLREAVALGEAEAHWKVAMSAATDLMYIESELHARFDEAEAWERHARAWLQRAGGDELDAAHLDVTSAAVKSAKGNTLEAEALLERALEVQRRVLGRRHPDTIGTELNLAVEKLIQGRFDEARKDYEFVLPSLEYVLGPQHPEVALAALGLGGVLEELGDLQRARELYERALWIHIAAHGPDHPDVASDRANLGLNAMAAGRLDEARGHFEHALEVHTRVSGGRHPEIAYSLGNLAIVADLQGDAPRAKEHFERALEMFRELYGDDHQEVGSTYVSLGLMAVQSGDLDEALAHAQRGIATLRRALPGDHPSIASAYQSLAEILMERHEEAAAARAALDAVEMWERVGGPQHPQAAESRAELAGIELDRGNVEAAEAHATQAIAVAREIGDSMALTICEFELGRVLWAAKKDRRAARAMVKRAADRMGEAGIANAYLEADLAKWLAEHG